MRKIITVFFILLVIFNQILFSETEDVNYLLFDEVLTCPYGWDDFVPNKNKVPSTNNIIKIKKDDKYAYIMCLEDGTVSIENKNLIYKTKTFSLILPADRFESLLTGFVKKEECYARIEEKVLSEKECIIMNANNEIINKNIQFNEYQNYILQCLTEKKIFAMIDGDILIMDSNSYFGPNYDITIYKHGFSLWYKGVKHIPFEEGQYPEEVSQGDVIGFYGGVNETGLGYGVTSATLIISGPDGNWYSPIVFYLVIN